MKLINDLETRQTDSVGFDLRCGSLTVSLRFDPEALARLTRGIGAGFLAIPRRGAETGGVLIGEMVQNDSD